MQSTNTLGRYHIIRELARSNDIVYEALDPTQGGKRIALKELQMPGNLVGQGRRERIERFMREARSAARLKHENIVRIFDYGQAQDRHFIAMEFLEGQSLRDVLRQRGSLPLQEALRIAAAVADGLQFAHKNGVIHRDIKPDNVHLEPNGRVVITDFGIARLTFEPTLTADGQVFGTPSYMSPEQVAGKGIDPRSDLFSLGVMLYEMVSGRKPFTGDSVITITYNIMNSDPPPMVGACAVVEPIVRRALSKDVQRRYGSAGEMAEDLRLVLQNRQPKYALQPPPGPVGGPMGGPSGGPRGTLPSNPAPRPNPQPAPPPAGGRPMPQPMFGGQPAGPMSGPVPGARPMAPGPRPGVGPIPVPRPAAAMAQPVPMHPGAMHPGAMQGGPAQPLIGSPPGAAPQQYQYPRRLRNRPGSGSGGSDFKWILGWLALATVIGGMLLTIIWASVTAYDRFRVDATVRSAEEAISAATEAYNKGDYPKALKGYQDAAKVTGGERHDRALRQAALTAAQISRSYLNGNKLAEAERFARQAIDLNADCAQAYVALGRALALQGRIDPAIQALDGSVEAAKRTAAAGRPELEVKEARAAAQTAPLWKADALYRDGEDLLRRRDPEGARRRFEAVIRSAPDSEFARNAQTQLSRLQSLGASAAPVPGAAPDEQDPQLAPPPSFSSGGGGYARVQQGPGTPAYPEPQAGGPAGGNPGAGGRGPGGPPPGQQKWNYDYRSFNR